MGTEELHSHPPTNVSSTDAWSLMTITTANYTWRGVSCYTKVINTEVAGQE